MIELRDVSLCVGGRPLLSRVNAHAGSGELVALLGPNGAGKTTLLRAMAGLHPIAAGAISLDGTKIEQLGPRERARRIAFVTADEVLIETLGVRDVASIGRFPHHRWWQWRSCDADAKAVAHALEAVGMRDFADRLFSTLSSGERQRIWIALGLAQETPILLLDEPTSHLDVRVAHEILALLWALTRAGKTVICALHDLNEAAAYADRIGLLGNGTLVPPRVPEAVLNDPLLDRLYGIDMERVRLASGGLRIFANASDARDGSSVSCERPSQAPNA